MAQYKIEVTTFSSYDILRTADLLTVRWKLWLLRSHYLWPSLPPPQKKKKAMQLCAVVKSLFVTKTKIMLCNFALLWRHCLWQRQNALQLFAAVRSHCLCVAKTKCYATLRCSEVTVLWQKTKSYATAHTTFNDINRRQCHKEHSWFSHVWGKGHSSAACIQAIFIFSLINAFNW